MLLKLFVSKKEDYPSLLIDLKNVLNELEIQQQIYLEMQTSIPNIKKNLSFDLTLEYGIIQNQVTIDWLKNTIKRIKESL